MASFSCERRTVAFSSRNMMLSSRPASSSLGMRGCPGPFMHPPSQFMISMKCMSLSPPATISLHTAFIAFAPQKTPMFRSSPGSGTVALRTGSMLRSSFVTSSGSGPAPVHAAAVRSAASMTPPVLPKICPAPEPPPSEPNSPASPASSRVAQSVGSKPRSSNRVRDSLVVMTASVSAPCSSEESWGRTASCFLTVQGMRPTTTTSLASMPSCLAQ
mmetsp:Transcript_13252/g.28125  ORF Transcript_13252/g.28125 Transcript_13252/m.28125 type:complete len:216 (-) Transcript_13252:40-687(-)